MKRGWSWPAAVIAILGATVAANIWLIRVASADPSFAVEERYYQRALAWDDELAQRDANAALGWRTAATIAPVTRAGAAMRVRLTDAAGQPIDDAAVVARVVAVARAGEPVDVALHADSLGGYVGEIAIDRAGLWEIRYDVRRGTTRFTATERVETHRLPGE